MKTQTHEPSKAHNGLGPGGEEGQLWGVITSLPRTAARSEICPVSVLGDHLSRQTVSLFLGPSYIQSAIPPLRIILRLKMLQWFGAFMSPGGPLDTSRGIILDLDTLLLLEMHASSFWQALNLTFPSVAPNVGPPAYAQYYLLISHVPLLGSTVTPTPTSHQQ